MNILGILYCRSYQAFAKAFALPFLKIEPVPTLEGEGSLQKLPGWLRERAYHHPFVVLYSKNAYKQPSIASFLKAMERASFHPYIFDETRPNPAYGLAVECAEKIVKANCDVVIALGGGSAIDLAKAAAAIVGNDRWGADALFGNLKVKRKPLDLIAVPTTAGSGSETSPSAVLLDEAHNAKRVINDPKLLPLLAVLDPALLKTLSPERTVQSGLDALSHAVESFVGKGENRKTRSYSIQASRILIDTLPRLYSGGALTQDYEEAARASYLAGAAFSRGFVGYAHALSHAIGGLYDLPHGLLNAILLPRVLEAYGKKAHKALARLADASSLTPLRASNADKARAYIAKLRELNASFGIPDSLRGMVEKGQIASLSKRAAKEANPLYPVPRLLSHKELAAILEDLT